MNRASGPQYNPEEDEAAANYESDASDSSIESRYGKIQESEDEDVDFQFDSAGPKNNQQKCEAPEQRRCAMRHYIGGHFVGEAEISDVECEDNGECSDDVGESSSP
jgi:hypothetical protein